MDLRCAEMKQNYENMNRYAFWHEPWKLKVLRLLCRVPVPWDFRWNVTQRVRGGD
jgi:hypothetical protein